MVQNVLRRPETEFTFSSQSISLHSLPSENCNTLNNNAIRKTIKNISKQQKGILMIHSTVDKSKKKAWLLGPWESKVPIPVGYANHGVNEMHYHKHMFEIYLVAKGESIVVVDNKIVTINSGDMLVVEPNEVHCFKKNSSDYLHFVVQVPFVKNDKSLAK